MAVQHRQVRFVEKRSGGEDAGCKLKLQHACSRWRVSPTSGCANERVRSHLKHLLLPWHLPRPRQPPALATLWRPHLPPGSGSPNHDRAAAEASRALVSARREVSQFVV